MVSNPVTDRRRRKRMKRLKIALFLGLGITILIAGIWLFFFSPFFEIQAVRYEGLTTIPESEFQPLVNSFIESQSLKFLPPFLRQKTSLFYRALNKRNWILVSRWPLKQMLVKNYPALKTVEVSKSFINRILVIKFNERQTTFIWCQNEDNCYYGDQEGIIFEKAPESLGYLTTKIYDEKENDLSLGQAVLNNRTISFIQNLATLLKKEDINISYWLASGPLPSQIKAVTEHQWQIFLNPVSNASQIVDLMKSVLEKEIKNQVNQLEYIDLRYKERIYYKLK